MAASKSVWIYVAAAMALAFCLWLGWSDFDAQVPQETVRATIHGAPRLVAQVLLQFVAPLLLIAFLARPVIARVRAR